MNNACLKCKKQQAHSCLVCIAKTVLEWRKDRDRLERELNGLRRIRGQQVERFSKLQQENERLRHDLEFFGEHDRQHCKYPEERDCNCGLDEALAADPEKP